MKTARYTGILLIVLYMVFTVSMTAFAAADAVELDSAPKGSISVDLVSSDSKEAVAGGTLTLYQVAEAKVSEGEIQYTYTDAFANCGVSLTNVGMSDTKMKELASNLEAYVKQNAILGQNATINERGHAEWTDLEQGLYLFIQTSAAEGYAPVCTFLASVPESVEGAYIYEINAKPKVERVKNPDTETPGNNPDTGITDRKLPQTGQLWWPVPILAFAGLLFFILGWFRRKWSESDDDNR